MNFGFIKKNLKKQALCYMSDNTVCCVVGLASFIQTIEVNTRF